MTDTELAFASATALRGKIASKEVSPVELVDLRVVDDDGVGSETLCDRGRAVGLLGEVVGDGDREVQRPMGELLHAGTHRQ